MLESQEWPAGAHREASDMGRSARSQRVALRARHARPPPHRVHSPSLARCKVGVRAEVKLEVEGAEVEVRVEVEVPLKVNFGTEVGVEVEVAGELNVGTKVQVRI